MKAKAQIFSLLVPLMYGCDGNMVEYHRFRPGADMDSTQPDEIPSFLNLLNSNVKQTTVYRGLFDITMYVPF